MRSAPIVDWTAPTDPVVAACLTVKCGFCGAKVGEHCISTVPNMRLLRTVHHYRLDKVIGS